MTDRPHANDPEALLRSTTWMRGLARSLVSDDASADDVVQQACLAMVRTPPRQDHAAVAWLQTVIRNLALRKYREDGRRRERERRVARPEAADSSASAALERAELQKTIVTEVLALDEPYRTALVLRYFDELSAQQIAESQGVPEKTIRTRLARGLERLRTRLDSVSEGGRSHWCALLVPLLGPATISALATMATGGPQAAATGVSGGSVVSSSAGMPLLATGGVIMSKIGVVLVGGITLAVGLGVGRYTATAPATLSDVETAHSEVARVTARAEQLDGEVAALTDQLGEAESARDAARSRTLQLEEQLGVLQTQLEALKTAATPEAAELAKKLAVSFGEFASLEAFQNANWPDMAEAVQNINALLLDLIRGQKNGEPMPEGFQQKIQAENARLLGFAAAVIAKIPTHSPVNGEFTHPLATANLMSSMLDKAELPTSEDQRNAIAQVGEDYEREYTRLQSSYGEDTLKLTKVLDELELKRASVEEMQGLLTREQVDVIVHPDLHHRYQVDALSPFVSALALARPQAVASREDAVTRMRSHVASSLGLQESDLAAAAHHFERWGEDVSSVMVPIPAGEVAYMHMNEATTAGRAYERLLRSLAQALPLGEATFTRIRSEQGWMVPRLVITESSGGGH